MKQTPFTRATKEVVDLIMQAVDAWVEEEVEPLEDIGNPEKLIGKKYEDWTPQDLQLLGQVYGEEPNALSDLIFKREYDATKELEKELEG